MKDRTTNPWVETQDSNSGIDFWKIVQYGLMGFGAYFLIKKAGASLSGLLLKFFESAPESAPDSEDNFPKHES